MITEDALLVKGCDEGIDYWFLIWLVEPLIVLVTTAYANVRKRGDILNTESVPVTETVWVLTDWEKQHMFPGLDGMNVVKVSMTLDQKIAYSPFVRRPQAMWIYVRGTGYVGVKSFNPELSSRLTDLTIGEFRQYAGMVPLTQL